MLPSSLRWTLAEDKLLWKAVARYGHSWQVMKRLRILPGRPMESLRKRWLRMCFGASPFELRSPPIAAPLPNLCSSSLPWPEYTLPARDRAGGRPWDYFISRTVTRSREPSERQANMLALWCLDEPNVPLLLCNLGRAESIVRRYLKKTLPAGGDLNHAVLSTQLTPAERDELQLAYRPGEACHTLTSAISNLYWVCGSECKNPGFLLPSEVASFMGHNRLSSFPVLRHLDISDRLISSWLAESVHSRMAEHCASIALSLLPYRYHYTVGSLYSGAFDALATGFVDAGANITRVFAAELDQRKSQSLRAAFGYMHMFPTSAVAAARCPAVDILVASPSCHEVSRARDLSADPGMAASAVEVHSLVLEAAIRRTAPRAVVIEQSDGLRTHHADAYDRFRARLDLLPYCWLHRSVDAHTDYAGTHFRARLLWVGVRADLVTYQD